MAGVDERSAASEEAADALLCANELKLYETLHTYEHHFNEMEFKVREIASVSPGAASTSPTLRDLYAKSPADVQAVVERWAANDVGIPGPMTWTGA